MTPFASGDCRAMLRSVAERPDDVLRQLALADWLRDHGVPEVFRMIEELRADRDRFARDLDAAIEVIANAGLTLRDVLEVPLTSAVRVAVVEAERDAVVAAAVAAETERCAGIARGWAEYHRRLGDSPDADFVDGEELADDIETDIRSGKQP